MATDNTPLPHSEINGGVQRILSLKPHVFRTLRGRIYGMLGALILLTLAIEGVAFFFLLGGYQNQLAESTLRQIAAPVYSSVVTPPEAYLQPLEVSRQLTGSVAADPEVRLLFVDERGVVLSEASTTPRFRGEQLNIELTNTGVGLENFIEGTLKTNDDRDLNYLAGKLSPEAQKRFNAEFVVLALPSEDRQTVLGDLTSRLLLAGGLALLAAIGIGLLLSRSIYRPLQATTAAARSVARGQFNRKMDVGGTIEAQELAESFNQMTDEVQRQQAALRDFLANVSHDLQTPLTSINGFSQALLDGTVEGADTRQNAYRIIEDESRRLLRLVEGLLDLSRMEAGQVEVHMAPINVENLFRHIHDLFALRSEELGVHLEIVPTKIPDVSGDIDRLEQVLANLVDNALRHTPSNGNVVLSASRESEATIGLAVSDTGTGISDEDLPHLFDRFYQAGRPGTEGGTGLGLAIARELTRAQQGEIQVDSTEGIGTTFRVLLRIHQIESRIQLPRTFE